MKLQLNKEDFLQRVQYDVQRRNELLNFYENVFLPMLDISNGKVYNIRFIKALRNACQDELMWVRELENNEIRVDKRSAKFNYSDYESIYMRLILNEDGRIDKEASLSDRLGQSRLSSFKEYTKELSNIADNYDEYMKVCENLKNALSQYKDLPYRFRQNVGFWDSYCIKH
jgi:hypothetical protein